MSPLNFFRQRRLAHLEKIQAQQCDCPEATCCSTFPDCDCTTPLVLCEHKLASLAIWKLSHPLPEDLEELAEELLDLDEPAYTTLPEPPEPTDHLPRTGCKVEAMAARAAAGYAVFHPDDLKPTRQQGIQVALRRFKNGRTRLGRAEARIIAARAAEGY